MRTVTLLTGHNDTLVTFQSKCDHLSKICVVLLALSIPISTMGTSILLMALLALWLLGGNLLQKLREIYNHPVSRIVFFLFSIFAIGALYSPAPLYDISSMLSKMGRLLYIPLLLPSFKEEKWRRLTIGALVAATALTVILSFIQCYLGHSVFETRVSFMRRSRVFSNFNTSSCVFKDDIFTNFMMALASFIIGHAILLYKNTAIRTALFILLAAIVFYMFFISYGRTGQIIFVSLWMLFGFQRLKTQQFLGLILALTLTLVSIALYSPHFQKRVIEIQEDIQQYQMGNHRTSMGERYEFATQTLALIKDHPWMGYGTGSFKKIYGEHAQTHHLTPSVNPHNEYLNILFQVGGVGLALILGLFFALVRQTSYLPDIERWLAQGLLLSMGIGCLANSWFMDRTSSILFVVMLACCFGALPPHQRKSAS